MRISSIISLLSLNLYASSALFAAGSHYESYDSSLLDAQRDSILESRMIDSFGDVWIYEASGECEPFINKHFPWQTKVGEKKFQAEVKVDAFLFGNCQSIKSGATADIDAVLFEKPLPLADAQVMAYTQNSNINADAQLLVLGYEVAKVTKNLVNTEISVSGNPSRDFDQTGEYRTAIGPFPINMKYGATGRANMAWRASASVAGAEVNVTPRVNADGYVITGSSVEELFKLEVKGNVKLINDTLSVKGGAKLANVEGKTGVKADLVVTNSLQALDGSFTGSAQALDKTLFDKEFFKWNGITDNRKVAEYSYSAPIPPLK